MPDRVIEAQAKGIQHNHQDYVTINHIPTVEDANWNDVVIGSVEYSDKADYARFLDYPDDRIEDTTEYNDACNDREAAAHLLAYEALNDAGIDTTDLEIRIGEFRPGEIRLYGWAEAVTRRLSESVCKKLGITTEELNRLYTTEGGEVEARICREQGVEPDERGLWFALKEKGVLTEDETTWLILG